MNNTAKLAVAAAVVVVAALLGYNYFATPNVGDDGLDNATPSPTAGEAAAVDLPQTGSLVPGTYRISDTDVTPVAYRLAVPTGWSTDEGFVTKGGSGNVNGRDVFVTAWEISHVFADVCPLGRDEDALVETPTAEAIVAALADQVGHETTGPTSTTLGGHSAQLLEFSIPVDGSGSPCDGGIHRLWPGAGPNMDSGQPMVDGQRMAIYVLDFDGTPVVIVAASSADATPEDLDELQGVVDSLRFDEGAP